MPTHLSRLQRDRAPRPSRDELYAAGKALRKTQPHVDHAIFVAGERDPKAILAEQNAARLPELVPLRMGRMLDSAFTFYRGTAAIMAHDLAQGATTGIQVVACGDAHLSNFGLFASPQRTLVFDLNDFDEAASAPWEWDLKRLVASVVVGARDLGLTEEKTRKAARKAAAAYREGMREMVGHSALDRYYLRLDTDVAHPSFRTEAQDVLAKATKSARKRTSQKFVDKLTERAADGTRLIVENPPVMTHVPPESEARVEELFEQYRATVSTDVAFLLGSFTLTDVARRAVGVGSVGTRCFILILTGPAGEALVLQVKEAPASVLETYGDVDPRRLLQARTRAEYDELGEGYRVVSCQRILQAVSDPFLGYLRFAGEDGIERDFYVRQFRDMKGSVELEQLTPSEFSKYGEACGTLLARAHAQSPIAPMIAGYLGKSGSFDGAMAEWAIGYAEQSALDYAELLAARDRGDFEAVSDR
ncbi:DUF2252 domain-containing protein [Pseudoclavibacter sp. RFBA6]|uniref:DUF2252 domain-containing protein n=1 Tax=Pseudoclavibacter sp. RFBA6 TaxID=2080573 RepID=UPI000CE8CEF2|nr:DUF2252 domain-containing protein [Pseudoclavibacter sp. RFBA6]PPG40052.1 DUF2252 domain-containing protein [Pseudoclavibacter sp. RFBA6]